ncbi:tRNA (5-methylaminomethyl-2-thiouridine)(34)-methyltransferase MnmD [uncultured Meiothermus sp.]|uniref:tRNA (5-methylaminomethyl-2-thiouridine)(34)-methyltransferase MnmD n=1 Tax=uncultured Meiothermus sp. TaxID=157471 RepID=UPI002610E5EF|nr:tRNA (5-methylaminomethyl-2-thiouridine)(34)-methyltransferase MnmD [uncultured Meiothermus sp.]
MAPDRPEFYRPVPTEDGSLTLVHPVFGEAYSSRHGAWMQASELYLKLTQTQLHPSPRVLEIGFGLGMNFRAALESCVRRGVYLEYLSYEGFPVSREVLEWVEVPLSDPVQAIWNGVLINWPTHPQRPLFLGGSWGSLEVRYENVTKAVYPTNWASAIYLDPFSPAVNPEPWKPAVLHQLYTSSQPGAYLATYSVAGRFRRDLHTAGFAVKKVPGVGKKEWTVGRRV